MREGGKREGGRKEGRKKRRKGKYQLKSSTALTVHSYVRDLVPRNFSVLVVGQLLVETRNGGGRDPVDVLLRKELRLLSPQALNHPSFTWQR